LRWDNYRYQYFIWHSSSGEAAEFGPLGVQLRIVAKCLAWTRIVSLARAGAPAAWASEIGSKSAVTANWFTVALTALVLAGVNSLMVALNLRQNRTTDDAAPKPAPSKAWVDFAIRNPRDIWPLELLRSAAGAGD
jgi:hypothetical protein